MKLDQIPLDETGSSNPTDNRPFYDVLSANMSRRSVLTGSLAVAGSTLMASNPVVAQFGSIFGAGQLINFTPIPVALGGGPEPAISADYQFQTFLRWGEPLEPGGPAFEFPPTSAEKAALQINGGHDGMHFFPLTQTANSLGGIEFKSSTRGVLALNNEFIRTEMVFEFSKKVPESLEEVRIVQNYHGVTIVEIAKNTDGDWEQIESNVTRKVTTNSNVTFSGPAANSPYLQTPNNNVPLGTLNNCAHGVTPWGTYLTCEENFNGYFGTADENGNPVLDTPWEASEEQQRYGFTEFGFAYFWHKYDRRFNLADPGFKNEENRFGWVVEIDPMDPTKIPVKRTALGRFKHENAHIMIGDGNRVVVYMGDDQRFDYVYKFVSADDYEVMLANGISPLDEGTLYAARYNDDGSGDWLALDMSVPALAARFNDQGELVTFARIAADIVGATPMDRPEWATNAPNGDIIIAMTNNTRREPGQEDAANPLAPNPDGFLMRMQEGNFIGTSFTWDIFLFAADTRDSENVFTDPDGILVDEDGRLFIETDGGQPDGLNNQLLVTDVNDPSTIYRLFTGVAGCEITGICFTPDRRTMFINVQHPGNGDPALTSFPAPFDGVTKPRDAVVAITRKNGGIIGS